MRLGLALVVAMCLGGLGIASSTQKPPSILIITLIRNKAHTLPYFLSYLHQLDYPRDRISIWIRSDHNEDNSVEIAQLWVDSVRHEYHDIDFEYSETEDHYGDALSRYHWSESRFRTVIDLKEQGLRHARKIWADYAFLLDADVFLTNPNTLQALIGENVTVVSPMLQSDGLYSNYWCGMTSQYYYERTDEYKQILDREKIGAFAVPMIHSAMLIDLNHEEADKLTYDHTRLEEYSGPVDDIIIWAMSANYSHISMYISNTELFGYIATPLDPDESMAYEVEQLVNTKLLIVNELSEVQVMDMFKEKYISYPSLDRMSLDKIFMINLWRREERRLKMEQNFRELGLEVEHFLAVDGHQIDENYLKKMDIRFLPGYEDPYSKRPMTMGEIGCFLSHYYIWQRMVESGLEEVLILEDDIRFEPFFKQRFHAVLEETRSLGDWDLVYVGRKRLLESEELWVDGTNNLVRPNYSYWTLGYLISLRGARKLLATHPLQKLVPVDEYLPIMFDMHPNQGWKDAFPARNLNAFSAAPLLLFPTHYTGETGYISDTEDSVPIAVVDGAATASTSSSQNESGQEKGAAAFAKSAIPTTSNAVKFNENHVKHEL